MISRTTTQAQSGLSYLEVLIAVALLAVSAVPVGTGLMRSLDVTNYGQEATEAHFHIFEKMEEVLSYSYAELAAAQELSGVPTRYSDDTTSTHRRLVFVFPADGDNSDADNDLSTGGDDDLLIVRAEYEDGRFRMEALKSRP